MCVIVVLCRLVRVCTCWGRPMDIDYWNHMNNARYARKFEWGRQHFLQRTGLGRALTTMRVVNKEEQREKESATKAGGVSSKRGVHFGFGSLVIRYRREVGNSLKTSLTARTRLCFLLLLQLRSRPTCHDGLRVVYIAMPFSSPTR